MKVLLAVLLVGCLSLESGALQCRRCSGAVNLDECTYSTPCGADEYCFVDQVVTDALAVLYNAGCRPKTVCLKNAPGGVGKRDASGLVACSECCNDDTGHSRECNTKLCGIKSSTTNVSQCYHCSPDKGLGSAVSKASDCTNLETCQSDEVCGTETYRLNGEDVYEFKCLNRKVCSILTRLAIQRREYCIANPNDCGLSGRQTSGDKICSACCGDALCNSEECNKLIDRLTNLKSHSVLDFETLKVNGTIPTGSPPANSTASSG